MRRGGIALAALLCAAAAASCVHIGDEGAAASQVPEFVLTYAENQTDDYPTTQGAYRFAELVKERTHGRIHINVQSGAVLGDEKSVIEQLQFGGLDFARVSLSPLCEFVPKLNVLQLPYLYRDADHMWKVLDGEIGEEFLKALDGSNLVALSWYDAGARNFYTAGKQIQTLEDMDGQKIRVQESGMMIDLIEALGGIPVPMAYAEVYSALQTGVIDGAENNWPSYESMLHYEVALYYTTSEHNRVPEMQLISQSTWNSLSAADRDILRECARESAEFERSLWKQREKRSKAKVLAAGNQLYEMPAEERARFKAAVLPIYETYCSEYMDLIERITNTE